MNPNLQVVVWMGMLSGLRISTGGMLAGRVQLFRLGWFIWIAGIFCSFRPSAGLIWKSEQACKQRHDFI
ncbi:MAG TPA: hypothetical protein VFR18_24770 [Terriglobia bacterium]|nr:hypothetical protein [Terriglobia bacterium]